MKINKQPKYTYSSKFLRRYVEFVLLFFSVSQPLGFRILGQRIDTMIQHNGTAFAVRYLKRSHMLFASAVAGNPLPSHEMGVEWVATVRGFPRIIPGSLRLLVEAGDLRIARVILTIITYYRIIKIPGILKLSTITDPFKGISSTLPVYELAGVMGYISHHFGAKRFPVGRTHLIPSVSASPNYKRSVLGAPLDALALSQAPEVLKAFRLLSDAFGSSLNIDEELEVVSRWDLPGSYLLGKLSKKLEPAGKIRVFAMVDIWTQSVLEPLHELIFSILKNIPQDGCFNQAKPLRILQEKIIERNSLRSSEGSLKTFSFDLSAATDRLPIDLQVQVLELLLQPYVDKAAEVAQAWKTLLIDRPYHIDGQEVRYAVGQPMGALSSWGMLSLTHHVIVQLSARRALGLKDQWFSEYSLLGDDIVIANEAVANVYLTTMRDILGVDININKSIISPIGVVEFAKRLLTPKGEFSPLGAGGIGICLKNIAGLSALFTDYVGKGGQVSWSSVVSFVDRISTRPDIVRVSRRTVDGLIWAIVGPMGHYPVSDLSSLRIFKMVTGLDLIGMLRQLTEVSRVLREREARSALLKMREAGKNLDKFISDFGVLALKGQAQPGFGPEMLIPPSYRRLQAYFQSREFQLSSELLRISRGTLSHNAVNIRLAEIERSIDAKARDPEHKNLLLMEQVVDSIRDLIVDSPRPGGLGCLLSKPRVIRPRVRDVDMKLIRELQASSRHMFRHGIAKRNMVNGRGKELVKNDRGPTTYVGKDLTN